jgi:hypothetical protein
MKSQNLGQIVVLKVFIGTARESLSYIITRLRHESRHSSVTLVSRLQIGFTSRNERILTFRAKVTHLTNDTTPQS